jgi:hypothetical protein
MKLRQHDYLVIPVVIYHGDDYHPEKKEKIIQSFRVAEMTCPRNPRE